MTSVVLFHHAQGLTDGVRWFGDQLRAAGHDVTQPDLYEGVTFDDLDVGVAHADEIGMNEIIARGVAAIAQLPAGTPAVVGGFSLGTLPAQKIAQTRPGVRGAILYHGGLPSAVFGGPWQDGVALQLHVGPEDKWAEMDEHDALIAEVPDSEIYLYPGTGHLIADNSLPSFDAESAGLIIGRSVEFLNRLR
jgi:dienelactone hydrolase